MYTIYINEVPLVICKSDQVSTYQSKYENMIVHHYARGRKGLFNYIDAFEKSSDRSGVILSVEDPEVTFTEFCSIYKVVEAAGGLVFNKTGQLLAIFRRANWDLPKGKIEKDETIEEAAIREVQEETGLDKVVLKRKIGITYHTFSTGKQKRMLKVSHWYKMKTAELKLTPQVEEDIELTEWVEIKDFLRNYKPMYRNIQDIVSKYLSSKKKKAGAPVKV